MSSTAETKEKILRITLVRSTIGFPKRHKATIRALGLHRLHQTVEHVDTPTLRGMLYVVDRLVVVEE
jgi:large subunit ribosomal protein L30